MAEKIRTDLKEGDHLSNADWKIKVDQKTSQERDLVFILWFLIKLFWTKIWLKSRLKFKVFELATGNQQPEEWLGLPENLSQEEYFAYDDWVYFSDKNFVAIDIEIHDLNWMLLILNLATRKRYWIPYDLLEEKIYGRITDVDLEELSGMEFEIYDMRVKPDRIEIEFHKAMEYHTLDDMPEVLIGQS